MSYRHSYVIVCDVVVPAGAALTIYVIATQIFGFAIADSRFTYCRAIKSASSQSVLLLRQRAKAWGHVNPLIYIEFPKRRI